MAISKISDLLNQTKALPDKKQEPKALTPVQTMIGSLTFPQLVADWSGTSAQIAAGQLALSDIVQREDIPTLADVNRMHGNIASLTIIAEHLISVVRFAGVEMTQDQAKETALVILSGYYHLNLAELAMFFHRLKCGELGQVVFGKKINNQAIMCALHNFAAERRQKIDRIEAEKAQAESLERRAKNYACAVIGGIEGHYQKCDEDFYYFVSSFPFLQDLTTDRKRILWGRFKENREDALKTIWGIHENQKVKSADYCNDKLKNE